MTDENTDALRANIDEASFDDRLKVFLDAIVEIVVYARERSSGALRQHGLTGAHIMLVESVSLAEKQGTPGYLTAAAYAIIASMIASSKYYDPVSPQG